MVEQMQEKMTVQRFLRRHWKPLLFLIITAALIAAVMWLLKLREENQELRQQNELILSLRDGQEKEEDPSEINVVITSSTIEQQLNSIRELVTQEYIYTNADKKESSESWIFGWERPFSGKSIIITYDGIIKAGVDLSDAQIDVDEETRTIRVVLPASKITENNIPQETINIVEVKNGLFNDVTLENYNEFVSEQKEVMEQKAIDQGLLTKADAEAKALVKSFLSVLPGIDDYTLIIEQSD